MIRFDALALMNVPGIRQELPYMSLLTKTAYNGKALKRAISRLFLWSFM